MLSIGIPMNNFSPGEIVGSKTLVIEPMFGIDVPAVYSKFALSVASSVVSIELSVIFLSFTIPFVWSVLSELVEKRAISPIFLP